MQLATARRWLIGWIVMAAAWAQPSAATDVRFVGSVGYSHLVNIVYLSSDEIHNYSATTSAAQRIELWATPARFSGSFVGGYQLAAYGVAPLAGGTSLKNVNSPVLTWIEPPSGTYYVAMVLTEQAGALGNGGYVARSWLTFSEQLVGLGGPAPPPDSTPPSVSIASPTGGSVSGTVTVSASASDNVGVARVDFYVNGGFTVTSTAAPYQFTWNTAALPNGSATLRAVALDAAGNSGQSALVTVNVANAPPPDTTPPTVSIASPTGGNVAGTVTVSANASDNVGVSRVDFYVNGALAGSDSSAPYTYAWNTTALANGSATLRAVALDAAGNSGQSALVTVIVANVTSPPPAPHETRSDVNGDGRSDVVWRNAVTGVVSEWRMNGFTVSSGTNTIGTVPTTNWVILGVGDFDGDGKADILWRNTTTGEVNVWFVDGTTIKPTSRNIATISPTLWQFAGIGDVNGDGMSDILWRNAATGDVYVWLMNGSTLIAGSGYIASAPSAWQIVATGDIDGDGKDDLLWQNTQTGAVNAWLLNGPSVRTGSGNITTLSPTRWAIAGMGDFDGDGKSDIVWRDLTNGDVHVWLMSGLGLKSGSGYVMSASPSAKVVGVADYDGDGKADLLWRDANDLISLWLMNGMTIKASAGVGSVTADWLLVTP